MGHLYKSDEDIRESKRGRSRRRRRFDLICGGSYFTSFTVRPLLISVPVLTGLVAMPLIFTPSSPTRHDRVPEEGEKLFINDFAGLESWDDPTPRPSLMTLQELTGIFVVAANRQFSLRPKSPTPEERMERKQERRRSGLILALDAYAKRNNMQHTELEFVKARVRNQVEGYTAGLCLYVHFNFLVKGSDGRHTLFFAEVLPNCTHEEQVVLCTLLEENDSGHGFECGDGANELKHPSGGGYLGIRRRCFLPGIWMAVRESILCEGVVSIHQQS